MRSLACLSWAILVIVFFVASKPVLAIIMTRAVYRPFKHSKTRPLSADIVFKWEIQFIRYVPRLVRGSRRRHRWRQKKHAFGFVSPPNYVMLRFWIMAKGCVHAVVNDRSMWGKSSMYRFLCLNKHHMKSIYRCIDYKTDTDTQPYIFRRRGGVITSPKQPNSRVDVTERVRQPSVSKTQLQSLSAIHQVRCVILDKN